MPVHLLLIAAVVGALTGWAAVTWLLRRTPRGSRVRLVLTSTAVAPVLIIIAVLVVSLYATVALHGQTGEQAPGALIYVAALLGAICAIPASIGAFAASVVVAMAARHKQ